MAIGAVLGGVVSAASYAIGAAATGQEITLGGVAGAAIGGAFAGAISVIASPLAGSAMALVGLNVTAGSVGVGAAIINGAAGAIAYKAGGEVTNTIDVLQGKEPEFHATPGGAILSSVLAGGLAYGVGRTFPVGSGQYSLAQAQYFLPGHSVATAFATQNAINQFAQVGVSNFVGTLAASAILGSPEPKLNLKPKLFLPVLMTDY